MDVNILRSIITLLCFFAFIGIVLWSYSGRQQQRFDEASQLPFADDDMQNKTVCSQDKNQRTMEH